MEAAQLNDFITGFPVKGSNVVEKAAYMEKTHQVWINSQQYFGGVPEDVWRFYIGG